MQVIEFIPKGVCSKNIKIEVDDALVIEHIEFNGGCSGNLQGIAALLIGMKVDEAIKRLKGISCGYKETSCPDQLALALEKIKKSV